VALKFNASWRFNSPEDGAFINKAIPDGAIQEFRAMISKVTTQGNRQGLLEHYKSYFCTATGTSHVRSSNESWAETDLIYRMQQASSNAPLFIEAFYDASEALRKKSPDWFIPDTEIINSIIVRHKIGYEVRPPDLILRDKEIPIVPVTERPATIAEKSLEIFQKSLERSEELLSENKPREAVQEILWLLETATTAFRGIETEYGTIQGNYFNQIIRDLRKKHGGKTLDRILEWVTNIHGFLSSPSGGGVRHGLDLNDGIILSRDEARLFINLIRSYLSFLLTEYERLNK
jgi:hypothetical protein